MHLPNFFVLSAGKAGTTALHHTLQQHPEIFMCPIREPHFFAFEGEPPVFQGPGGLIPRTAWVWRWSDYLALFSGVTTQHAIGEASTGYLYSPTTAQRIRKSLPTSRLVALLRQPAERAYSSFCFNVQCNIEPARTFTDALAEEETRKQAGWYPALFYKLHGYYHAQLAAYYNLFPRHQIRVYLYEDWKETPEAMLRDLFGFLEVDDSFVPELRPANVTMVPRSRALHRLTRTSVRVDRQVAPILPSALRGKFSGALQRFDRRFNLVRPAPLNPEIRARLTQEYREDILKLQNLIARDLSHWLKTT